MVSLSELNILSSLSSSEVSEEVNVNDAATNCGGRVTSGTTLYAFPIRSIWGSITCFQFKAGSFKTFSSASKEKAEEKFPGSVV